MNLRGLRVLRSLSTLITGMLIFEKLASINELETMKKSSFDHDSLKYEPLSMKKPSDKAFMKLSKEKEMVKNKSKLVEIIPNRLSNQISIPGSRFSFVDKSPIKMNETFRKSEDN